MTAVHETIECYPAARRAGVRAVFSYTDPLAAVTGHDGVDRFIGGVQQQFAGVRFTLAGAVDVHHDVARFTWHARVEGREDPLAIGFDVVVLDGERIKQVVGFLDKVPS